MFGFSGSAQGGVGVGGQSSGSVQGGGSSQGGGQRGGQSQPDTPQERGDYGSGQGRGGVGVGGSAQVSIGGQGSSPQGVGGQGSAQGGVGVGSQAGERDGSSQPPTPQERGERGAGPSFTPPSVGSRPDAQISIQPSNPIGFGDGRSRMTGPAPVDAIAQALAEKRDMRAAAALAPGIMRAEREAGRRSTASTPYLESRALTPTFAPQRMTMTDSERRADMAQQMRALENQALNPIDDRINEAFRGTTAQLSKSDEARVEALRDSISPSVADQARRSDQASAFRAAENKSMQDMAAFGKEVKSVVSVGPGFTTVQLQDGTVEKRSSDGGGARNNNPGNMMYGAFTKGYGAVGKDSRGFAVFPTMEAGINAQKGWLGDRGGKTISEVVSAYAPKDDGKTPGLKGNDPEKYAATIAAAINVPVSTKISDLTDAQLSGLVTAMHKVEGQPAVTVSVQKSGKWGDDNPTTASISSKGPGLAALAPNGLIEGKGQFTTANGAVITGLTAAKYDKVAPEAKTALEKFADLQGRVALNSSYRSPEENRAAKGAPKSLHMDGKAFDISLRGKTDAEKTQAVIDARAAGFSRIGAYTAGGALHVDTAKGYSRDKEWGGVHPMFDTKKENMGAAHGWFTAGLKADIGTAGKGRADVFADTPKDAPTPASRDRFSATYMGGGDSLSGFAGSRIADSPNYARTGTGDFPAAAPATTPVSAPAVADAEKETSLGRQIAETGLNTGMGMIPGVGIATTVINAGLALAGKPSLGSRVIDLLGTEDASTAPRRTGDESGAGDGKGYDPEKRASDRRTSRKSFEDKYLSADTSFEDRTRRPTPEEKWGTNARYSEYI